uniref:Uncharacterized protein n=1 Tax=Anguilla anguilla TaxID=7936 RepID=A0A0E9W4B0_ANGAN
MVDYCIFCAGYTACKLRSRKTLYTGLLVLMVFKNIYMSGLCLLFSPGACF